MGIFGGAPKQPNVAEEQARLKAQQDAAARQERDKIAQETAAKENRQVAKMQEDQSARTAFTAGIAEDTDESRRKFLKKV